MVALQDEKVRPCKNGKKKFTPYNSFYSKDNSNFKNPKYFTYTDDEGKVHGLIVVAFLDASSNAKQHNGFKWRHTQDEYEVFADALNDQWTGNSGGSIKIPLKYQPKGESRTLDRWYVCYWDDDPSNIEIWAVYPYGKGRGEPLYRVYPNATY